VQIFNPEVTLIRDQVWSTIVQTTDPTLIADQRNCNDKYLQNGEENWSKSTSMLI